MADNKDNALIPDEIIMNQIYYIRGHKVMLDTDLASLYEVVDIPLHSTPRFRYKVLNFLKPAPVFIV